MSKLVTRFANNQSGATAIEYGLIAALIAVVLIAGLTALGNDPKAKSASATPASAASAQQ